MDLERDLWSRGLNVVVGVDEAGVGPLSGPVIVAAVSFLPGCPAIEGVRDSKTLSHDQRQDLFVKIRADAAAIGIGGASVAEVDRLNVMRASHLAMRRALRRLGHYDLAIVDGRPIRDVNLGPHVALVDADATSYVVACASIVAKVTRDQLMVRLGRRYPAYGWDRNAGYGTAKHLQALLELGPTPYHRSTFAPVRLAAALSEARLASGSEQ